MKYKLYEKIRDFNIYIKSKIFKFKVFISFLSIVGFFLHRKGYYI